MGKKIRISIDFSSKSIKINYGYKNYKFGIKLHKSYRNSFSKTLRTMIEDMMRSKGKVAVVECSRGVCRKKMKNNEKVETKYVLLSSTNEKKPRKVKKKVTVNHKSSLKPGIVLERKINLVKTANYFCLYR
jgi:hypothetical protein